MDKKTASHIAFSWLLHLRWGALAGQMLVILAVHLIFKISIPLFILTVIILFAALSNIYFQYLMKRKNDISDWLTAAVMFLDIVFLTLLIANTGGPMNPFTFLYLVHIALGSILLKTMWSWGLTFFTIICYAAVFFVPLDALQHLDGTLEILGEACHDPAMMETEMTLHLQGMWVAFSITSIFIVFFIGQIQKALEEHQETIDKLKEERIRNEKLAALATLSAGAAHEFSTPLSTIAVAAGEMIHSMKQGANDQELLEDAQLIRNQVERCKEILYQLSADAGEPLGEASEEFRLNQLLDDILAMFSADTRERFIIDNKIGNFRLQVPYRTLKRTLRGILKNAIDASPNGTQVLVNIYKDQDFVYFKTVDTGDGMPPEILAKATEPFFTTKAPGKGLGLGLFLARSVAERFGGNLVISSTAGKGTEVTISFALERVFPKKILSEPTSEISAETETTT